MKKIILVLGLLFGANVIFAQIGYTSQLLDKKIFDKELDSLISINNRICPLLGYLNPREQSGYHKAEFLRFKKLVLKMNAVYADKVKSIDKLKKKYLKNEFKKIKLESSYQGLDTWKYDEKSFYLNIFAYADNVVGYSLVFKNMDQFCYDEYMGIDTDSGYLDYRGLDILKGKVLIPISLPMSNHDALSFEWTTK